MERQMFSPERQRNLVIQHNRIPGNESLTWAIAHSMPLGLPAEHDKLGAAWSAANDLCVGRGFGVNRSESGVGFDRCGGAVQVLTGRMRGSVGICIIPHGMTSYIIRYCQAMRSG